MNARALLFFALGMVLHEFAAAIDNRHKAARREALALLARAKG